MKKFLLAAGLALSALTVSVPADAQGLVGGARRGAAEGDRVGGPVGGVIGGAVGAGVGTVNGALGIDPGRRAYRTDLRSRRGYHHRRHHRHHRHAR
ncbi:MULTISPECIES: hypothetical protein [Methylobacterium]|uniref:Carboxylesterase n=1 Tax=Methylobacterium jeotgali TaxID=381630 RepID=A0ABQ4STG9_9HYPH|nr:MULTISPECIES: hypothetical protein [Methylobacterium]PIU06193.1 MAG: hypothetical protein COT56_10165 [Methylobacterium sp. CG09_land_8_20_14_0_10_71_15]PIU14484.1 MAG: hypothetical protein COT28_07430 [Methylobacterium sp. CG08_land_8_20_14_0_20_71_15]GBU18244.1 hypothetical protein AwMethylo_24590 [Methylobacterium sp.]GJE05165.1 hypothetical protein AOPFMNJM_0462 [Methylobacterium jeotgali]